MSILTYTRITRITRTDGQEFGFTELDRDLIIGGLTYKANTATEPEALKKSIDLGADKLKIKSILNDEEVTEGDIIGGKYSNAKVVSARIDYTNLPPTILTAPEIIFSGTVGEITTTDTTYIMEVRNLVATLNQGISVKASPTCRNSFGDTACFNIGSATNDLTPLSFTGFVVNSNNRKTFELNFAPTISLKYGRIEFTSGKNRGIVSTIEAHDANTTTIELLRSLPFTLEVGDTVSGSAGCTKTPQACKAYGNWINFGGFPPPFNEHSGWMPGTDHIISSPLN